MEQTLVTQNADEIANYVARRTVYTEQEIRSMTESGPVLSILFRAARRLAPPITLAALKNAGILKGAPQSIQAVREEGVRWLESQLREQRS